MPSLTLSELDKDGRTTYPTTSLADVSTLARTLLDLSDQCRVDGLLLVHRGRSLRLTLYPTHDLPWRCEHNPDDEDDMIERGEPSWAKTPEEAIAAYCASVDCADEAEEERLRTAQSLWAKWMARVASTNGG